MRKPRLYGIGFFSRLGLCFVVSSVTPDLAQGQSLASRVSALEAQVTVLQQQVAGLEQQVDTQAQQLTTLQDQVNNIGNPAFINVDCSSGETVAGALGQAAGIFRRVTITIHGVCQESVSIGRDDVTLRGTLPGDGLEAPSPTSTVLRLLRAQRIVLQQLTITGGSTGLQSIDGSFVASDLHVSGAANAGVRITGSGFLTNCIVEDGAGVGVVADSGGAVSISGGRIDNNQGTGAAANLGGSVVLFNGAVVQNNQGFGLVADGGGQVALLTGAMVTDTNGVGILAFTGGIVRVRDGAIVENNAGNGVELAIGSTLNVATGAIIRGNGGDGINIRDTSVAELGDANLPPQIVNNGGYGIVCAPAPGVAQIGVGVAAVTGNALGQVNCPVAPLP